MSKPTTLYDKIWNDHLVHEADDGRERSVRTRA